jgi:DNA/RNA endonuclease YhcR with UshA esterase domain
MMIAAALCVVALLTATAVRAETIEAEDAADHVGDQVTVKMEVEASKYLRDRGICFLNSMRNHRDPKCFTAVIFSDGLEAFAAKGIEDPSDHFYGKTIEVSGTVEKYRDKAQIEVTEPDQIEVAD